MPAATKNAGIGDVAVRRATGKSWSEWFAALDADGARAMTHAQIATHLHDRLGVPGWWCQMVAVGYEQVVLGRKKHQRPDGFEVSISRTIGATAAAAFRAFKDSRTRGRWLPGADLMIRKATPGKSLRMTWDASAGEKATNVMVDLYPKDRARCQVVVQHAKLPSQAAAARAKKAWSARLDALRNVLEG
jgi:uncharacterized protein YndB with AHSA1/START domain